MLLDERGQLYLADFGIARALESATRYTRTGTTIGTPEYMAPEQARGQADHRSDLYAAGVILYQLLTGRVPFTGDSAVEILDAAHPGPGAARPGAPVNPALPAVEPHAGTGERPQRALPARCRSVADLAYALSNAPERPNAQQPDNQLTVFATPTPHPVLGTTPVPYVVPATPQPNTVAPAAPVVVVRTTSTANRPPSRNLLVIGLSVALRRGCCC
ncbi:MAG: protein kinase [Thermomicrobiales bacterium]